MSHTLRGETFPWWRTPILCGRAPAGDDQYHADLCRFVLAERVRREGIDVGTVDATKTQSDLLRLSDPVIEPLRELVAHVAETMNKAVGAEGGEMIAEAWAVVYDRRGYHRLHAHHDSAWSGVYYVSIGSGEPGRLELVDPRPAACARDPMRSPLLAITPEAGMVVAFPSWVQHWATPHAGDEERICVAFNIGFVR